MKLPPFSMLDIDQRKLYAEAPIDGAILITGPPGTGKTVIAAHRAIKLSSLGKPVVLGMFNKVLRRYTSHAEQLNSVKVVNMDRWIRSWYQSGFGQGIPLQQTQKGYYAPVDWRQVITNINQCDNINIINKLNWGHLIIDEGQDFSKEMYRAFIQCMRHKLHLDQNRPSITVFADENQTITDNNSSVFDLMEELNASVENSRLWRLDKNYRNSLEIAKFSRHFQVAGSTSAELPIRKTGNKPTIFFDLDVDRPLRQIVNMTVNLGSVDVGVLVFGRIADVSRVYAGIKKEVLSGKKNCRVQCYTSNKNDPISSNEENLIFGAPPSITVVHFMSSKGLEFDTVFVENTRALEARDSGEISSFKSLYVASSRARDALYYFFSAVPSRNVYPEAVRLLPDPSAGLSNFISTVEDDVDLESMFDVVDWCDSAYEYKRHYLKKNRFFAPIIEAAKNPDKKSLMIKNLTSFAENSFMTEKLIRVILEKFNDHDSFVDIAVEFGDEQQLLGILLAEK